MQVFSDSTGRRWEIALPIGTVIRVKSTSGGRFNLFEPESQVDGKPLREAVFTDLATTWELVWLIVEPQASAANVTAEQFGQAMAAECMIAAAQALQREWADFFRRLQRPDTATALELMGRASGKALAAVQAKLATIAPEAVEAAMDKAIAKVLNESPGLSPA